MTHAAPVHDRDAFRRNVDGRDLDASPLQFERMKPSASTDIEHTAMAEIEGERCQRIDRLPQPEGGRTSSRTPS